VIVLIDSLLRWRRTLRGSATATTAQVAQVGD
jgi:hypothetical protein